MLRLILLSAVILFKTTMVKAQCQTCSEKKDVNTITIQCNGSPVAMNNDIEVAIGASQLIWYNTGNYHTGISFTIGFISPAQAQKTAENVVLVLENGQLIKVPFAKASLEFSDGYYIGHSLFSPTYAQVEELKKSKISSLHLTFANGKSVSMNATHNKDVLIRLLGCLINVK